MVEGEDLCLENKQSVAESSSSDSGVHSPVAYSLSNRRTTGPIRRAKGGWTPDEDETLRNAVSAFNGKSWKKIAEFFPDRSEVQCLHRWQKVLNPELVKGPWTQEEDEKIIELVARYGPTKWSVIAKSLPGRIGKQCRERWHNHLNPDIKKEAWTLEEELALMNAHRAYGNKWAEIAKYLPGSAQEYWVIPTQNEFTAFITPTTCFSKYFAKIGKQRRKLFVQWTDNAIKNHWNSSLKKKLDFYLATGKLPPSAKNGPQPHPRDAERSTCSEKMVGASDTESDSSTQTSSGVTNFCTSENNRGEVDLSRKLQNGSPSFSDADKSANTKVMERLSYKDFTCRNSDSLPFLDNRWNDKNGYQHVAVTSPLGLINTFDSLSYKPPEESCRGSNLASNYTRPDCSPAPITSQIGLFTPPSVKSNSPGSILKMAANTFPNTPSIIRKRRAKFQNHQSRKTGEMFLSPPSCSSAVAEFVNDKSFNASPPYRLSTKRKAIFKCVEKQLVFEERVDAKSLDPQPQFEGNAPIREDMLQTNIGIT